MTQDHVAGAHAAGGTLALLSGGLDSTTLVADLVASGEPVQTVAVHYGQRHVRELDAAAAVAAHFGLAHDVIDLSVLREHLPSALTGTSAVPHGHYAGENMAITVVPNRNMIMLSVAAGIAMARGLDCVATAVHSGDHPIYADCRPPFVLAANLAVNMATDDRISLAAPYMRWTKAEIASRAAALSAPVGLSWSCYEGGENHCGRCGTCVERAEAFAEAHAPDPTVYADPDFWMQTTREMEQVS